MRAVGLFGGCFDPVHNGHAAIVAAASTLPVERVLMVVNGQPAHRREPAAGYRQRIAMADIAVNFLSGSGNSVEVCELEKPGRPRYAIDTVSEIRRQGMWPVLIVGSDALAGISSWHRWQELLATASFAVVERPGAAPEALHPQLAELIVSDASGLAEGPCVWRWSISTPDCSSSRIRTQLAAGRDEEAEKCLDEQVFAYIRRQRLYAAAG